VYENKGPQDKMPDEKAHTFVQLTRVLQEIAGLLSRFELDRVLYMDIRISRESPIPQLAERSLMPVG
jgi:hypothetical protein